MAREATLRKYGETLEAARIAAFGGGDPPAPPKARAPVVSNARLAILMFIAAELMFFAGLIGAFIVFKLAAELWPPAFQPRLPVAVTGVNTAILLLSGVAMQLAMRAARRREATAALVRWLTIAALLGVVFLIVQGYEWIRLIGYGLTLSSGVYGGTFYTLIGCHGAHVLGAVTWLGVVLARARSGRYAVASEGVEICGIYWTFVVALWPALYALVYL
jgi:heme/copper-type cytochrome/quinol oxidase subunit 3